MILYEIALIASLLIILFLVLVNRRRYEARCPRCGERDGQLTVSKREVSRRHVRYRFWRLPNSGWSRPPMSADQRFLEGTMKCSRCGHSYERRWFEQRELF
jgi:hypothetical protein